MTHCNDTISDTINYINDTSNMSACVEEKSMINSNDDEASYKEFYNAIRSGNIKQLDGLINKWSGNEFDVNIRELDDTLSRAYEELKLKNVKLSEVTEIFVENKLINLRFISNSSTKNKNKDRLGNIEKRIELVLETINQLNTEYSGVKKVDEKFLFVAKFIAQNIHILKQQLRITYGKLPWEEMEFCLIGFVSSHIKQNEINLFYHSIFDKSKILKHLQDFKNVLKEVKKILKDYGFTKLVDLPKQTRERVATGIIEQYPQFEELYEDHQVIRDIYSLQKIQDYVNLVISADANEREGQLIVTRGLQVIGEYFKNTLESPNLSTDTSELLVLTLPKNTRNIVIDLRNSLSHAYSLFKRTKIEENTDVNFFNGVQNDTKKIKEVINDILHRSKIKIIQSLLKKIIECEDTEEIKQVAQIFSEFELDKKIEEGFDGMMEHDKLEKLIKELQENIANQTNYEKQWFHEMNDVIMNVKSKSENNRSNYNERVILSHTLGAVLNFYDFDKSSIGEAKYFANKFLEACTSTIESQELTKISKLAMEISRSAVARLEDDKCDTINKLAYEICFIVEFGMSELKWIGRLRDKLNSTGSFRTVNKPQQRMCVEEKYDQQLELKLAELKSVLKKNTIGEEEMDKNIPFYRKNKKLLAVVEMLVLDIMSILGSSKNYLENNLLFLDENTPLLTGKCLRNHLAHDNTLVDILLTDPSLAVYLNAEKLISENVVNTKTKFGKLIKDDPSKLKKKFERSLMIITNQEKMFAALEEGNTTYTKTALKNGADINGRNINLKTALHFAAQGGRLEVVKYILIQNGRVDAKDVNGQTALHVAAAFGRKNIVEFFIKRHANIDDPDNNQKTPLHIAAQNGHKETVQILLENGADVFVKDIYQFSPLHYAIRYNHIDIIEIMLKGGINNELNEIISGMTLLHLAVESGHSEVVSLLLKKGVKVNARNDEGGSPLHMAALSGNIEIVNALILNGADVNSARIDGCTPLHCAQENGHEKVVKVLLSHKADVNATQNTFTTLHYAAQDGNEEIVKILLENGANGNVFKRNNITPLHFAAGRGHLKIVALLLEYRVHIHVKDSRNASPLHYACRAGHKEVAEFLIKKGSKINEITVEGHTPLYEATMRGHEDTVQLLIQQKAKITSRDINGNTPLHAAVMNGCKDVVNILINNESEINAENNDGKTSLYFAVQYGHEDVVDLLLKRNAVVNTRTKCDLTTPLHEAAFGGHKGVVKLLIEYGAKVNTKDIEQRTPLHLSVITGHEDIVRILVENQADIKMKSSNVTPLILAISHNHDGIVKFLVENGAHVNSNDGKALILAVSKGNRYVVDILLKNGARIEVKDSEMCTPLHLAVKGDYHEIVNSLIKSGANVNATNVKKNTSLHIAAQNGHGDVAESLIVGGAKVNCVNIDGFAPLHKAAAYGHVHIVKLLLSKEAIVNIKNNDNRTPLELAVRNGQLKVVKILLPYKKGDINARAKDGNTILHFAALEGNLEIIKFLVDEGCSVNARNIAGSKPIHISAEKGHKDIVEYLHSKGNGVNDLDKTNQTPLHFAVTKGYVEMLKYLISQGADVNFKDAKGETCVHKAAKCGYKEIIKILFENGAIYNERDNDHKTPLEIANNGDVIKLLKSTDKLFEAVRCNSSLKVRDIIKVGASVYAKNVKGNTVLHYAAKKGYDQVVEILLQNKANPNSINAKGYTPLRNAVKMSRFKIVKSLLSHGAIYDAFSSNDELSSHSSGDNIAITHLFNVIRQSFEKVENRDTQVINFLERINDFDIIKAVMNARNKKNQTLFTVAVRSKFSKINKLKDVKQLDISNQINACLSLIVQGDCLQAIDMLKKLLKTRKEILGPDNPGTLDIQVYIAKGLFKQGNYTQALEILEKVYEKQEEILGSDYKDTLSTRSTIALILHEQEEYDEALKIFREVYQKQKQILGPNDLDSLSTLCHMALVLDKLEKYDEALIMNEQVYKNEKKILGENNPATICAQNNIAMVLSHQGKNEKAFKMFQKVLQKKERVLGENHADTLRTLSHMAGILANQNKYNESLRTYQKVLNIQENMLPRYHPDLLNTKYEIGNVYFKQGKFHSAYEAYKGNLEVRKSVFGPNHPTVLDISKKMETINFVLKMHNSDAKEVPQFPNCDSNTTFRSASNRDSFHPLENAYDSNDRNLDTSILFNKYIVSDGIAEFLEFYNRCRWAGDVNLYRSMFNLLTQGPTEVNTTCEYTSLLHLTAATCGTWRFVVSLLEHGASYNTENVEGKIPLDFAINPVVASLLQYVDQLFKYAKCGDKKILEKFKEMDKPFIPVMTNVRNKEGNTLLQVAVANGHKDIADELKKIIGNRK